MAIHNERCDQMNALFAWLESQEIPSNDWGPLLAQTAGVIIAEVAAKMKDKLAIEMGHMLLSNIMLHTAKISVKTDAPR